MSKLHRGLVRGFLGKRPAIDPTAFIADNATIVGDVTIGARSSIWFGAVLRGDGFHIRIGDDSSIQDNTVIHVTHGQHATQVGNKVTVGHSVTLHGCTVGDACIIGMGAVILDQAVIGDHCIVG
ncbi:MAG TPA: gamma carbonic anhydrase family protein, partial [Polyangia bacterium]|nr:gamma carbonic anhydrase family protein [Polyangia bacterium]